MKFCWSFSIWKSWAICSHSFLLIKVFCSTVNKTIHGNSQLMQQHQVIFNSSSNWNFQLAFNKILFTFSMLVFKQSQNFSLALCKFKKIPSRIYRCGRNQATFSFIISSEDYYSSWIYQEIIFLMKIFPIKIHRF